MQQEERRSQEVLVEAPCQAPVPARPASGVREERQRRHRREQRQELQERLAKLEVASGALQTLVVALAGQMPATVMRK